MLTGRPSELFQKALQESKPWSGTAPSWGSLRWASFLTGTKAIADGPGKPHRCHHHYQQAEILCAANVVQVGLCRWKSLTFLPRVGEHPWSFWKAKTSGCSCSHLAIELSIVAKTNNCVEQEDASGQQPRPESCLWPWLSNFTTAIGRKRLFIPPATAISTVLQRLQRPIFRKRGRTSTWEEERGILHR